MAANLTRVQTLAQSICNASRASYGLTVDDAMYFATEFADAAIQADLLVIGAILDTPNHRRRAEFLELATVSDGAIVPKPIGAVWIDGKPGTLVKPSTLRRFKLNRFSLTTIADGGYYYVEGNILFYIGSSGKVESIAALSSGNLHTPDEYEWVVTMGTLSLVVPKEGTKVSFVSYCGSQFQSMIGLIRQGASYVPAPTPQGQKL